MIRDFYSSARLLFVLDGCHHCAIWKSFIERVNFKLPLDKRIQVVTCNRYYDFGITDNPLILKFSKYLNGSFPVLFFDGFRMDGASSRIEVETFMKTLLMTEFWTDEKLKYLYQKDCRIITEGFFKGRMICD